MFTNSKHCAWNSLPHASCEHFAAAQLTCPSISSHCSPVTACMRPHRRRTTLRPDQRTQWIPSRQKIHIIISKTTSARSGARDVDDHAGMCVHLCFVCVCAHVRVRAPHSVHTCSLFFSFLTVLGVHWTITVDQTMSAMYQTCERDPFWRRCP